MDLTILPLGKPACSNRPISWKALPLKAKGALLNSLRTSTLIADADVVVVRFGEKFKQWNAAFDAGYAAALGKPLIILHPPEFDHALKEVDAAAKVVAREPRQVVEALAYAIRGAMPQQRYGKQAAE